MFINKDKKQSDVKQKDGFAVLFSVMLASFLITLGISIFSISLKEVMITTSVRDSQVAYYVADSARECALYWDVKQGAFPACFEDDCTNVADYPTPVEVQNITCNGTSTSLTFTKTGSTGSTYSASLKNFFAMSSADESQPVSDIKIIKEWIPDTKSIKTTIETRGHNTGIIGRRVERGIVQINN